MIARGSVVAGIVVFVFASPFAVAAATERAQISVDPSQWLKDYGPVGALVIGIVVVFAMFLRVLRPKIEAFLDAGASERLAFRDLANSLKHRFSEESIEERKLFRDAIDALRSEKGPKNP